MRSEDFSTLKPGRTSAACASRFASPCLKSRFQYPQAGSNLCRNRERNTANNDARHFSTLKPGRTSAASMTRQLMAYSRHISVPSSRVEPLPLEQRRAQPDRAYISVPSSRVEPLPQCRVFCLLRCNVNFSTLKPGRTSAAFLLDCTFFLRSYFSTLKPGRTSAALFHVHNAFYSQ